MDKSKLYLFYYEKNLYAFTINKEYKNLFTTQRNEKIFTTKSVKVTDMELSIFMNKYKSFMLIDIPLYDGEKYYTIVGTTNEDYLLSEECDKIYSDIRDSYMYLRCLDLKNKYKKAMETLQNTTELKKYPNGDIDHLYTINTLYLFRKLFINTFEKKCDE